MDSRPKWNTLKSQDGSGNPLQYSCLENPMDGGAKQGWCHGSQSVRHDWAHTHIYTYTFNPGEIRGYRSGYSSGKSKIKQEEDFPGVSVGRNPPVRARDMVQCLVWEGSTCHGATELMPQNYWACALEPMFCSKRRHHSEKPVLST